MTLNFKIFVHIILSPVCPKSPSFRVSICCINIVSDVLVITLGDFRRAHSEASFLDNLRLACVSKIDYNRRLAKYSIEGKFSGENPV